MRPWFNYRQPSALQILLCTCAIVGVQMANEQLSSLKDMCLICIAGRCRKLQLNYLGMDFSQCLIYPISSWAPFWIFLFSEMPWRESNAADHLMYSAVLRGYSRLGYWRVFLAQLGLHGIRRGTLTSFSAASVSGPECYSATEWRAAGFDFHCDLSANTNGVAFQR